MSSSLEIYIGAYAMIHAGLDLAESKILQKECINHPQRIFDVQELFCSFCGQKLEEKFYDMSKSLNYWNLVRDNVHKEDLNWVCQKESKEYIYLIGNLQKKSDCFATDTNDFEFPITANIAKIMVDNFKENYREILGFLETKVDKVEVLFGVLKYWW